MEIKLTFLWKKHEETKDIDIIEYLQTDIVPKLLEIPGVSHVEVCEFVPFSFIETPDEKDKHFVEVQMNMYYEGGDKGLQVAMANFNDAYLVEEIIRQDKYLDVYISYINTFKKEKNKNSLAQFKNKFLT